MTMRVAMSSVAGMRALGTSLSLRMSIRCPVERERRSHPLALRIVKWLLDHYSTGTRRRTVLGLGAACKASTVSDSPAIVSPRESRSEAMVSASVEAAPRSL